jgi:hypothetical protein
VSGKTCDAFGLKLEKELLDFHCGCHGEDSESNSSRSQQRRIDDRLLDRISGSAGGVAHHLRIEWRSP